MGFLGRLLSIIFTIIFIPIQIVFWIFLFLKANFGHNRISENSSTRNLRYKDGVITLDSDGLTSEETRQIYEEFESEFQYPNHTETVEHVYTLDFVENTETCPRCSSKTEQRLTNFIYDTDPEIRIMYVPAGYFCLKCPTTIVDLDLIKKGVSKNFTFNKLLGIENEEGINFFQSYNGENMVYSTEDLKLLFGADFSTLHVYQKSSKAKSSKSKKRKTQKAARKKNRSKK